MDPLSLAASIAGVIQISGLLISSCYEYGCALSDAPTEQRQLLTEISTLSGLLLGLQFQVNEGSGDQKSNIGVMHDSIMECHIILKDLAAKLESAKLRDIQETKGGARTVVMKRKLGIVAKRALWPLKRKDVMELVNKLERQKATMTMALSTDNLCVEIHLPCQAILL